MAYINKVKSSSTDERPGYLNEEIIAGNGIEIVENINGENHTLNITNTLDTASEILTSQTGVSVQDSLNSISGSIPTNLSDLTDVIYQTGDPANNDLLTYDTSLGKWTPKTPAPSGGGTSGISFFMPGNIYTGENIMSIRVPKAFTISKVQISVLTAPTGSALTVDVNYVAYSSDGTAPSPTTIFTTQASRPSISAGNYSDDSGTPDVTSVAAGGFLSFSVDAVGSTVTGANLMITIVAV